MQANKTIDVVWPDHIKMGGSPSARGASSSRGEREPRGGGNGKGPEAIHRRIVAAVRAVDTRASPMGAAFKERILATLGVHLPTEMGDMDDDVAAIAALDKAIKEPMTGATALKDRPAVNRAQDMVKAAMDALTTAMEAEDDTESET